MGKIIKFKNSSIEDKLMDSFSEYQLSLFVEFIKLLQDDFVKLCEKNTKLENSLTKKIVECQLLKEENQMLKGELNAIKQ